MIKLRYNTIGELNVMDYADKSKESYLMKKMENDKKQTIMILEERNSENIIRHEIICKLVLRL